MTALLCLPGKISRIAMGKELPVNIGELGLGQLTRGAVLNKALKHRK